MSWKSLVLSIFSVLAFWGLIVLTIFLFGFSAVLGIIGIIVTLAIPSFLVARARAVANGVLDYIILKFVVPPLDLIGLVGIILLFFLPA